MSTETLGAVQIERRRTYGNWVAMRSPGLFGVGLTATAVLFATPVFALLALLLAGLAAAVVVAVLGAAAFAAVGTPLGTAATRRIVFARHARAGGHLWRSGVFSRNADPAASLPGMLGRLELAEAATATGETFAVVHDRRKGGLHTVVLRCDGDGPGMTETGQVDAWVAAWARFLATAGTDPALVACKVIVDSAPDTGTSLAASVRAARVPGGPALAAAVMDRCAATYPALAAACTTFVEVTFRGRVLSRGGDRAQVLGELARRVPGLVHGLAEAGGGAVHPLSTADLARVVRGAYDPAARLDDHTDLAWADAGPLAAVESWEAYRHDSGVSTSWEMHDAPRAGIEATALAALLGPQPGLVRKRVALLLRPAPPHSSASAAEQDAATATFNASGGSVRGRVSAGASARVRATEQARHEVAAGAVLVRFDLTVTATVADPSALPDAVAAVESAAGAVPLRLRRTNGSQAAAFAATLPVGFLPFEHTLLPNKARELLK